MAMATVMVMVMTKGFYNNDHGDVNLDSDRDGAGLNINSESSLSFCRYAELKISTISSMVMAISSL